MRDIYTTDPHDMASSLGPETPTASLDLVELLGGLDLGAGALSTDGQAHGVAPTAVGAHVTEALDVVLDDAAGVVLDSHIGQLGSQGRDRLRGDGLQPRERMDAVLG